LKDTNKKHLKRNIPGKWETKILILIGIALLFLDQILKSYFIYNSRYYHYISFHIVRNTGISFGLFQGTTILMIVISLLFLGMLWWFRSEFKECKLCLMFLTVGTIGNLIDRSLRGFVVDFIDLRWFPVFNLSDALITVGTIGIVFIFLKTIRTESNEKKVKKNKR
jgi:signal peptidase II